MLVKSKSKRFANKAEETAWWEANEEAVADSFEEALKEGYAGPCTVGAPGIVADQFGARFIAGQAHNVEGAVAGYHIGNGIGTGDYLGAGLHVAGLIPGLNDIAVGLSIAKDIYQTGMKIAQCQ
jgi:hypothetical protein